jgi:orotidine-5'-phosphate decarboxylase
VILIPRNTSIVPACDFDIDLFKSVVQETHDIPGIGAYKIGAALGLGAGLAKVRDVARSFTDKPLIYDHQKAGTDIPETADFFMATLKKNGIDAVILFPFTGPATQSAWTTAAGNAGLHVIIGGRMTHSSFLAGENGYVADTAPDRIYDNAAAQGVTSFVVPGNKPDVIARVRERVAQKVANPVFYAPGFISQGGEISEAAKAAGSHWHAIVGRAIFEAPSIRDAALALTAHL